MQISVLICFEAVLEAALVHFEGHVFHGLEFALDFRVVFGEIGQRSQDGEGFIIATLQHEPGNDVSCCYMIECDDSLLTNVGTLADPE